MRPRNPRSLLQSSTQSRTLPATCSRGLGGRGSGFSGSIAEGCRLDAKPAKTCCQARVSCRADQAVALRPGWLCHPMAALDSAVEQPGERLWADPRNAPTSACSAPMSISRSKPATSATRSSTSRRVAKRIRAAGAGMVGLIGVQSNQYPRALDLGRQFRARGLDVVMGGFHVSRLHLHAAGAAGRSAGSARSRHSSVRRRSRRPHGGRAARCRGGHARSRSTNISTTCRKWQPRSIRSCRARW